MEGCFHVGFMAGLSVIGHGLRVECWWLISVFADGWKGRVQLDATDGVVAVHNVDCFSDQLCCDVRHVLPFNLRWCMARCPERAGENSRHIVSIKQFVP